MKKSLKGLDPQIKNSIMKKGMLILLLFFTSTLTFAQIEHGRSIKVFSVNFYTNSIYSVSCEKFIPAFRKFMDSAVIFKSDSLAMFDEFLDSCTFAKQQDVLDVRAKFIFLDKKGRNRVVCMDMFSIAVDGKTIKKNPTFYSFLRSLVPKKNLYRQRR